VQDHRQKFSVFNSSIGYEEQMRAMTITKRKLVLQERGSEEADVIRSTSSEAVHQKLTSSEVLKIIKS